MKKKLSAAFLILAALLAIVCAVLVICDGIAYDPYGTSAPFYLCVLVRALEFLLPAVAFLIAGLVLRRKNEDHPVK